MRELIEKYFKSVIESIRQDAEEKGQKAPVNSFRIDVGETDGKLFGAHYFKYLVTGRPPGKQPPQEAMIDFIRKNPSILADAKQRFKNITEKGLAYLIGRKIGREGTDIYQGKKPGIDLIAAMEAHMNELLVGIGRNEAMTIVTNLKSNLKQQ